MFTSFVFIIGGAFAQDAAVERVVMGKVKDSRLGEISGIAAAAKPEGSFWVHNDSGDEARIFLIDSAARLQAVYQLEGVELRDAEDIAAFRMDGRRYLLLADIGDNRALRESVAVYIFAEPSFEAGKTSYVIPRSEIRKLRFRYADKPRDAEAVFVDPVDLTGYIISKRDFHVGVYPFALREGADAEQLLQPMLNLPITFVTAADMSADGSSLLVKSLTEVYYWHRLPEESVGEMLGRPWRRLPYEPEPQGEAICFGADECVFYTISERPLGLDAYLYRYILH